MHYCKIFHLYFITLGLLIWPLYGHSLAISNEEPRHQAEHYLGEITSQLKRDALADEKMAVRRYIFASPLIEAAAVWGAKGQLLFPDDDGITHINDSLILKDHYRLQSLLATAEPTAWEGRDIKKEQLFYCQHDVIATCLLLNTSELAKALSLSKQQLLSEIFPSQKQAFFWWGYVLFILLISLLLIIWHRLRNQHKADISTLASDIFIMGDAHIDPRQKRATRDQRCIDLSERDIKLLLHLYQHPNEVLSKNELYDVGWGRDFVANSRALEQHIINLRKKLDPERRHTNLIETVHGQGYRYPASAF